MYTMQPLTVTAHGSPYELIRFTAPLPQPGPACCEPLPEEKREQSLQNEQLTQQRREAKISEEKEQAKNIIDKIAVTCNQVWNAIDKTVTAAVDAADDALHTQKENHAYGFLKQHFPQFITEKLLGDYRCKLCTRNGVLPGVLLFTNHHVMFIPDDGTPFAASMCEILCIQTFKLAEVHELAPMYHSVKPTSVAEAEGLQLFLTSNQLLIFKEFISVRSIVTNIVAEAFNIVDHAWRADATVPNPNWQFTDAAKFVQPDITVYPLKITGPAFEQGWTATTTQEPRNAADLPTRVPTQQEQRPTNALETHS